MCGINRRKLFPGAAAIGLTTALGATGATSATADSLIGTTHAMGQEFEVEPVIPFAFEVGGTIVVALYGALVIVSLILLAKAKRMTGGQRIVWVIAILFLPVIGPTTWIIVSYVDHRLRRTPVQSDAPAGPS